MQLGQQFTQRLEQKMGQAQIQSLDVLALPVEALYEKIAAEIERNPALEQITPPLELKMPPFDPNTLPAAQPMQHRTSFNRKNNSTAAKPLKTMADSDAFQSFLENIPQPEQQSLQAHLLEQLRFQQIDPKTAEYAALIIQNLDSDGFHSIPLEEFFKEKPYDEQRQCIPRALRIIRSLDPQGCAVRDFRQALLIQAVLRFSRKAAHEPVYAYTLDILKNHFSFLEKVRPYSLVHAVNSDASIPYKINQETAAAIINLVRTLEPFPGRAYRDETAAQVIIPAAFVRQQGTEFSIQINDFEVPLLTISTEFLNLAKNYSDEAAVFAKDYVQQAKVFIGSLNQREKTIFAVVQALVSVQERFFLTGDQATLVPLTQEQLADRIGIHESTVSRTVHEKYIQCRWGVFPLKYFFSHAVPVQAAESNCTKEAVKTLISRIIEESSTKLSDMKISQLLQDLHGITVARRTIGKYRKELAIGASYNR
ncbi:MAG: RNA polymerase factor sigma-54 [Treponema sp.]